MRKSTFVTYCLLLTFAFMQFTSFIKQRFNGVDNLRAEVAALHSQIDREKLQTDLVRYKFAEFQQYTATLIPDILKTERDHEEKYQLRSLASVVSAPDGDFLKVELSSGLFERAKQAFRDGEFKEANERLRKLIEEYPESAHVPEAHFLLAEGLFKLNEFDSCTDVVDSMVSLFPESELTGFALLRLGQIYESRDRREDAAEIYRAVIASYADQPLLAQAKTNLQAVEL